MATHSSIFAWEIPQAREAWQARIQWGRKESDSTEHARGHSSRHRSVPVTLGRSVTRIVWCGLWVRFWPPVFCLLPRMCPSCVGAHAFLVPSCDEPRLSICEVDLGVSRWGLRSPLCAHMSVGRCFPLSGQTLGVEWLDTDFLRNCQMVFHSDYLILPCPCRSLVWSVFWLFFFFFKSQPF